LSESVARRQGDARRNFSETLKAVRVLTEGDSRQNLPYSQLAALETIARPEGKKS